MKYIIIPLFRILTFPIISAYIFGFFLVFALEALWNFNLDNMRDIFINRGAFYTCIHYNDCNGKTDYLYCYKTVWNYLINKKTYGNG